MKQDELDLLHGYLDGTISDANFAKLQTLLRQSAQARRTLRGLATVDAKLQELGALSTRTKDLVVMPSPSRAWQRDKWLAWGSVAAIAVCVALVLTGTFFTQVKPSQPDVTAVISSTQNAIAQLNIEPTPSLPSWASPTASLLEQPQIPQ